MTAQALWTTLLFSLLALFSRADEAHIVFAGDAMMHQRQIDTAHRPDGSYDYSEYFTTIAPYVGQADYAVVNLETPVAGAPYSGYPCFNAPESYIDALADAGFDLFLTANNHTLDRRDRGLRATIDALDTRHLDHIGTYTTPHERATRIPFIKEIGGIRVGFINYTYGTNGIKPGATVRVDYIDRPLIRHDIEATRQAGAEIIVACVHWGIENTMTPHSSAIQLADYLESLGVEVIIGGHPHVVQPMHLSDGPEPHLRVYSLGNLISNMLRTDNRGGAMVSLTLRRDPDGHARVADASYRLTFTELPASGHGFRIVWPDQSTDPVAARFLHNARTMFGNKNTRIAEDKPAAAPLPQN